jgi:hypothetical protein
MVGKMGGFGLFGVVFKGRLIMSKLTPQNPKLMGLLLEFIVSVTFVFVYVKMMHIFDF